MADSMAATGMAVAVVTSDYAQHITGMQRRLTAQELIETKPYPIVRLRHWTVPGVRAYPLSTGLPKAILETQPDVIHAHCFYYVSLDAAAYTSVLGRIPFVASPVLPLRNSLKWQIVRRAMRWTLKAAAVTTVLSNYERTLLERSGLPTRKVVIVPPAVSSVRRKSLPPPEFPWTSGVHEIFLFVGRVSNAKGVDTLLEAFVDVLASRPEARLVLAGPWSADLPAYKELISALRIERYVWFAGEVTDDELDALYRLSAACVFPSRYEAFGIVAIEAMARGIPVVASDAAALPEVIDWGRRGVMHRVGDPASLADAIIHLMSDADLYRRLVRVGTTYVAQNHSDETMRTRLLEIYESARNNTKHRRSSYRRQYQDRK